MSQSSISILCTRPLDEWLITEASSNGIDIEILSFIETIPVHTTEVQQEIENSLQLNTTVIFTSMNAVEAVANELNNYKPDWEIYCIGYSTHELVKKYLGEKSVSGTASDSKELANKIIEDNNTEDVIYFCGNKRRDELPDILRSHEINVHEIEVYETISLTHKVDKAYDGILFFSPSAVESFFKKNKINNSTTLFAIGNTTADEIKKYSRNTIIISDKPGKTNLIKKMIEYYVNGK